MNSEDQYIEYGISYMSCVWMTQIYGRPVSVASCLLHSRSPNTISILSGPRWCPTDWRSSSEGSWCCLVLFNPGGPVTLTCTHYPTFITPVEELPPIGNMPQIEDCHGSESWLTDSLSKWPATSAVWTLVSLYTWWLKVYWQATAPSL